MKKNILVLLSVIIPVCAVLELGAAVTTSSGVLDVTASPGSPSNIFSGVTQGSSVTINGVTQTLFTPPGGGGGSSVTVGGTKTVRFYGLPRYTPLTYTATLSVIQSISGGAKFWPISIDSIVDPGPIVTISASQPSAKVGDTIVITATFASNGEVLTGARINLAGSPIASVGDNVAPTKSYSFSPSAPGVYIFTGSASTTNIPWQDYASVTVFFFPAGPQKPPMATITTDKSSMVVGDTAQLTAIFQADATTGDYLLGTSIESPTYTVTNPTPAAQGNRNYSFTPLNPGTYTFNATASSSYFPTKDTLASCKVIVSSTTGLSAWITATPGSGMAPLNATLTWGSTNATAVSVTGPGINSSLPNNTVNLSNLGAGTYTYSISAILSGLNITDQATITVANGSFMLNTTSSGSGTVTPGGVYPVNAVVTLTEAPTAGERFMGWAGDTGLSAGSPALMSSSLSVTMSQDRNIVANFAAKIPQTISFTPPATAEVSAGSVTLSAAAVPSGLPVTFTVVSGPGSISGNVLSFSGPGVVVIRAEQAGDATYAAATPVIQTIRGLLRTITVSTGSKASVNKGDGTPSEQSTTQVIKMP